MRAYWLASAARWLELVRLNARIFGDDAPQTTRAIRGCSDALAEAARY